MNEIEQLRQQIADLQAEATELKLQDSGKKTALNGTFGKLFSRYSIFYSPEFGIAVTIGGQLSLLMLIERLELSGIRVISANTDGIEMLIPAGREGIAQHITEWWQRATGLVLETEGYKALYSRDVNNYYRFNNDGSVKRKGAYAHSGVLENKHPDLDICSDAVEAFLSTGKPLRETIYECRDIRKFVRVRGAKGGAMFDGVNLGRAVRWYYQAGSTKWITDAKSGNKVAGSDGACPVMLLPDELPSDIDYNHYIKIAEGILNDIGCHQA